MVLYFSTEFCFNMQKIGKFGGREGAGRGGVWKERWKWKRIKGKKEREKDFIFSKKQAG